MSALPVIVFAFNRPDKLRRVLDALSTQAVERLIVFVDGPRTAADEPGVEVCRALARGVDWAPVEPHISAANLGVWAIKDHVTEVLGRYPAAIFLEDDCLPAAGFYGFMRQALERYAGEPRVFSIGGYQVAPASFFRGYPNSLVSGPRFMGWGWATWQDRWQAAWPAILGYRDLFDRLEAVPDTAGADIGPLARRMAAGETIDNWDVRVALAALALGKVHLLPVRGLIRNIGHDFSGMHPSFSNRLRAVFLHNRNVAARAPQPVVWLEDVSLNEEYAAEVRRLARVSQKFAIRGWLKGLRKQV